MSKKRLYEIAKELGKESKEVVARAKELGIEVKSHASSVESEVAARITASFSQVAAPKKETNQKTAHSLAKEQQPAQVVAEEVTMADKVVPKAAEQAQKSAVATKASSVKPKSRNFKQSDEIDSEKIERETNKMAINKIEKRTISIMSEARKIEMTVGIAMNNATIAIIAAKIIGIKGKTVQMVLQIKIALNRIKGHALISRRVQQL